MIAEEYLYKSNNYFKLLYFRALSVESDDEGPPTRSRSATRGLHKGPMPRGQRGQLYRKAQSLDHQMAEERVSVDKLVG